VSDALWEDKQKFGIIYTAKFNPDSSPGSLKARTIPRGRRAVPALPALAVFRKKQSLTQQMPCNQQETANGRRARKSAGISQFFKDAKIGLPSIRPATIVTARSLIQLSASIECAVSS
jgi:hypothetical protein